MAVDFNGFDGGTRFSQGQREGTQSRSDLEHEIALLHSSQSRDFTNGIGVDDKVLTESSRRREAKFLQ